MNQGKHAVLVVSHGSRSSKTRLEIEALVDRIQERLPDVLVRYAFLELEEPLIPEGIRQCVADGARTILVALNFLNAGRHVDEDIPDIVKEAAASFPGVKISITPPVGQHPRIAELFLDMICSGLNKSDK